IDDNTDLGNLSDGYHTFDELYEFRKLYNAALFNQWAKLGVKNVHKSKKHSDGELCFGGGWFIVVAYPNDKQISNHYEMKDWD
ncbi:WDGH domain-containing protein, partial [Faecalicatena contorta]|uniref:WDGH domain-containing protein n=1 Tax=Faecalicatena contorta TaxID=39482 RepID=UPI00195FAEB4